MNKSPELLESEATVHKELTNFINLVAKERPDIKMATVIKPKATAYLVIAILPTEDGGDVQVNAQTLSPATLRFESFESITMHDVAQFGLTSVLSALLVNVLKQILPEQIKVGQEIMKLAGGYGRD